MLVCFEHDFGFDLLRLTGSNGQKHKLSNPIEEIITGFVAAHFRTTRWIDSATLFYCLNGGEKGWYYRIGKPILRGPSNAE